MSRQETVRARFVVLLCVALSALTWGALNLRYSDPLPTTCEEFNALVFTTDSYDRSLGYPFVFAHSEIADDGSCVGTLDGEAGYEPYEIRVVALAGDIAVWTASTAVLIAVVLGLRRSYLRGGWVRKTPPAAVMGVVLAGSVLGAASGLVPYENNTGGMHCYSIDGYDDPRGLPLQHGWPYPYYHEARPACAEYRWVEAPDACNGDVCRDYTADPAQFYTQPLLLDMIIGISVTSAVYAVWRYGRGTQHTGRKRQK